MVAVVAQNTRLNTKFDQSKFEYEPKRSNPGLPIRPATSSPRRRLKPMIMNVTVPIQKSMRFFMIILPAFFARVKPVSTIANPACIQNTSAAPMRNQTPKSWLDIADITSSIIIDLQKKKNGVHFPKFTRTCMQEFLYPEKCTPLYKIKKKPPTALPSVTSLSVMI